MPTALPAKTILNGADNPTTAQMKTALGQLHDRLSESIPDGRLIAEAGTAAAPSLTTTGDANTGVYFPAADTVAIAAGGTERVRISGGNLGIGTNVPILEVRGTVRAGLQSSSINGTVLLDDSYGIAESLVSVNTLRSSGGLLLGNGVMQQENSANIVSTSNISLAKAGLFIESGALVFKNAAAAIVQRGAPVSLNTLLTLASDGNLLVGYNTSNGSYKLQVNSQIFATSSTIATSDGRYKENITPIDGALNLVKELNPVQFSWKKHPVHAFDTETPTVGFVAQELQQVLADRPYSNSIVKYNECTITAAEYETIEIEPAEEEIKDEDGNVLASAKPAITEQRLVKPAVTEKFLGIAEGNLIAILTKAIQEQQTLIESLTARITALEAK